MFSTVSYRTKIYFGFGVLVAFLAAMAVIGILALSDSSDGFARYRDIARKTNLMGRMEADMLRVRMHAKEFLAGDDAQARERIEESSGRLRGLLAEARASIANPERLRLLESFEKGLNAFDAAFKEAAALGERDDSGRRDQLVGQIDTLGRQVAADAAEVSRSYTGEQDELGPRLQAENATAERLLTFSGAAALALAGLIAVLITLSITRAVRKSLAFARQVADGEFDKELDIRERGDFGELATAMRAIPEVLSNVLAEYGRLTSVIGKGRLGERGNASAFKGGFAGLIDGANTIADSVVGVLENVPTPVMAIDTDFNILFLNKVGREVIGHQGAGQPKGRCHEFMRTSDCKTANCACARAMQQNGKASSETDAHPQGLDLEIAYSATPIHDQTGKVVGAFEIVVDQTAVKRAQQKMAEVAGRADAISQRLSSATDELAAQVEQVSQGSEVQRDRIQETATAMEQMNASVLEVARNAGQAAESSVSARGQAQEGAGIVSKAVAAIKLVHASAEDLQKNMKELGQQAEAIGQVMNVISDIADQTNLLALNAAIEAARAGEAGRGFAVVADEVRKLAEKTMGATLEVGNSIKSIQDAAHRNIESMNQAAKNVQDATSLASSSGEALGRIVGLVDQNAGQVEGIASASEEQSAASEQINKALEEVNRVVAETTDGMRQSSQAVQELAVMSTELSQLITELTAGTGQEAAEKEARRA